MGEQKVTIMVLKVDLKCSKCYRKVKNVLCYFPQIRDQVYDEKNDTVTIKVVCCSPEKIKEKIICKGGGSIKSIEIKVPEKPKPKPPEKPPKPPTTKTQGDGDTEKPNQPQNPRPQPDKLQVNAPNPYPPKPNPPPLGLCCQQCCNGQPGWPCFHGHGWPPPCYQYDGYCGRPVYDSYGGGGNYCVNRCDNLSEENPAGCTIM